VLLQRQELKKNLQDCHKTEQNLRDEISCLTRQMREVGLGSSHNLEYIVYPNVFSYSVLNADMYVLEKFKLQGPFFKSQ
jgi:hypothetical protein